MSDDLLETLETISLHSVNKFQKTQVLLTKMINKVRIMKQINI